MKRQPAVAGQFYSSTPSGLSKEVQQCCEKGAEKIRAIGVIAPHAGLMYSGRVAGTLYSRLEFPHTCVLLGPNHTGLGQPASIMTSGEWIIPTGSTKIDTSLATKILGKADIFKDDASAHMMEHSLEVQLPFLHHFAPGVQIVPIALMNGSLDFCRTIGEALADIIEQTDYAVCLIASSDMTHFESDSSARQKDKMAIDQILSLNPEGLYHTVVKENISMCGFIPATAMLYAAKRLGGKEASLIRYMTSGDVSGDHDRVVGYAGILIR